MSSAILYLAIIAIWAGVLIPRWLKRDSARGAAASESPVAAFAPEYDGAEPDGTGLDGAGLGGAEPDEAELDGAQLDGARADAPGAAGAASPSSGGSPVSHEEARQRILKARRRMLWMMLGLTAVGGALAGTGLAAWWVIAPPTVMLAGYLLVLREAAKSDAEAGRRDREAREAQQAARERARQARSRVEAADVAPVVPAMYAAAPVPADYDDDAPGRDFTLGHRYEACDDDYDEYPETRLRAVGD